MEGLLAEAEEVGYSPPEMDGFNLACHTGGPRILYEVATALGVEDQQLASSWAIMTAYGNLSGASNLTVLDHLNRSTADEPPETSRRWVLGLSMGPGACLEGVVLRRPTHKPKEGFGGSRRLSTVGSVKADTRTRAMSGTMRRSVL